jgi:error-prone DNA polymerase
MSFYELHARSAFSFLASGSQPEALVNRAAALDLDGVALLDRDTVSGAVRFHFAAKEKGIKPIVGAEITLENTPPLQAPSVARSAGVVRDAGARRSVLPLIPISLKGYQNLCKLITTIKLRNKKGEHFATRKDIEDHSEDLLCLTGGADGFLHQSIKNRRGLEDIAWLNYVFEKRLYVELQRHYLESEEYLNQQLLAYAYKLRIPFFASNGAYYADERDRELFDVFTCIKNHCTLPEAGLLLSENSERFLKSKAQMLALFEDFPEALERTNEIAARINFSMDELKYTFPAYPVPPGETMDSFLRAQAEKGAMTRYGKIEGDVREKLDKELALIKRKKLAGYFLVVWDITQFCTEKRILSQGRGSAANSIVCYSLGITAVDPVKANLLFERFLSENSDQYPDIDIDLPSGDDRELVIQHVYQKYGERGAGMTANQICYRGRSAMRDVGKVFGFNAEALTELNKLRSSYETFSGEELKASLKEQGFDLKDSYRLRKFSEIYSRILDYPRHLGQHSGGMVVSLGRLDGIVPLEPATMEKRNIIQWDKDDCENLGLVKIDLLGLGMMAVLRDTITLIDEHHGEKLGLYQIPQDDPKVYKALQEGDTVGMFQVESRAQIAFLPRSKPKDFYDIVVQVAIIRPGPIVGNMLNSYLKRREGTEKIDYIHPSLEPVLHRTLGVPLFQEQLLKISMVLANFTGSEADELRRAMGFKRPDVRLKEIGANLRAGMTRNGIDEKTQERIVKCVEAFANYGFPESHAASFALLAYASAYFMVHYRAAFMTAMLNNFPLGFYSAATLVKDAQRHGLHFKALDINKSEYLFTIESLVRTGSGSDRLNSPPSKAPSVARSDGVVGGFVDQTTPRLKPHPSLSKEGSFLDSPPSKAPSVVREKCVRVGLKFVKGLRKEIAETIAFERHKKLFSSVEDLINRVPAINKREVRALSLAGALNFENTVHRRQALWQSELFINPKGELFAETQENSDGAYQAPSAASEKTRGGSQNSPPYEGGVSEGRGGSSFLKKMDGLELVEADLMKTGISPGRHPMAFIREELTKKGILSARQTWALKKGRVVLVAGAVIVRQRPMTANNVVFITLEDETGHSNFICMPDVFERFRTVINQNNFLLIKGIAEERGMIKASYVEPVGEFAGSIKMWSHDFH